MDSRQQFEKRYPVPFNADWSDEYQRYIWNKKDNSLTAATEHSKLWEAWQASRESLVINLPVMPKAQRSDEEATYSAGGCAMLSKCIKSIEAAGLKVTP